MHFSSCVGCAVIQQRILEVISDHVRFWRPVDKLWVILLILQSNLLANRLLVQFLLLSACSRLALAKKEKFAQF